MTHTGQRDFIQGAELIDELMDIIRRETKEVIGRKDFNYSIHWEEAQDLEWAVWY